MKSIINMPLEERPREKLKEKGSRSLEDHELLSILLGSGQKNRSVSRLAQSDAIRERIRINASGLSNYRNTNGVFLGKRIRAY